MAETKTYEQVSVVDGPGIYRLVENPQSGSFLATRNPFEIGIFPHLIDTENLLSGVSFTTHPMTREIQLEPGTNHLLPGVINLVRAEDGQTAIFFDVDTSHPTRGIEVSFHMRDIDEPFYPIIDGDERIKTGQGYQLLFGTKTCGDGGGSLDLLVSHFGDPSPWSGTINIGDNPRQTIRDTASILGVILRGSAVWKEITGQ